MEQFLLDSGEYIMTFAQVVTIIAVGVMAILLPILVFRISWKTSKLNKKLDQVIHLLREQLALAKKLEQQKGAEADIVLTPAAAKRDGRPSSKR